MNSLSQTLLLTLRAGLAIPIGATIAALVNIRDATVASEFRDGVMVIVGGILLWDFILEAVALDAS